MKKRVPLILCLFLIAAILLPASAFAAPIMTDVDHYRYMNVYSLEGKKYAGPDQAITRGELVNVVFNLLNNNTKNVNVVAPVEYTDVGEDHEYYKKINFLTYRGFVSGYPDGSFMPDAPLTRAEFAEVLLRSQKLVRNETVLRAGDIEGHWAVGAINAVIAKKYMTGYPDGEFKPQNLVTRAEVATTMNRIYGRQVDSKTVIKNITLIDAITNQYVKPYLFTQVFEDLPTDHWAYDAMMEACVSHRIYWDNVGQREIWIKELID